MLQKSLIKYNILNKLQCSAEEDNKEKKSRLIYLECAMQDV